MYKVSIDLDSYHFEYISKKKLSRTTSRALTIMRRHVNVLNPEASMINGVLKLKVFRPAYMGAKSAIHKLIEAYITVSPI